jgi:hypothetical protein
MLRSSDVAEHCTAFISMSEGSRLLVYAAFLDYHSTDDIAGHAAV